MVKFQFLRHFKAPNARFDDSECRCARFASDDVLGKRKRDRSGEHAQRRELDRSTKITTHRPTDHRERRAVADRPLVGAKPIPKMWDSFGL